MLTRAKVFSLTMAVLLVLTLVPGAPTGYAVGEPVGPQGRLTTTSLPYINPAYPLSPTTGTTTRVSIASDGTQGNDSSGLSVISADGRYVVFASQASNLVDGDTNDCQDIFVHDRVTGQTERVSVASDGTQSNGISYKRFISADGRYVTFESEAGNLVSDDTNDLRDIFVHDRVTGQTERVSVASDGTQGDGSSIWSSISADGRYVAFVSGASNLVSDDTNIYMDIFVHDQVTGQTERVSVASDGAQGNGQSAYPSYVSISADGRYVVFGSGASNLVSGDTNGVDDVFVHDRETSQTTRVSVASDGTQGSGMSYYSSISADGRYVVFTSYASNLVSDDTNGYTDIFVHDRVTGQTERVSVASDGTQGDLSCGWWYSSISADGRYVAFDCHARNLVPGDTNSRSDVFVHDRVTGQTERMSVASDSTQGNSDSWVPSISADGRYVAFGSGASNLVSGDTNGKADIFVHDRGEIGAFSISGRVTDASSNPIANVTISTGSTGSTTTDASGHYTLTLGTGTHPLTPSKVGYSFSPARRIVNVSQDVTGQNFVGVIDGGPSTPFLDLPFDYGGSRKAFFRALQNWNKSGGRVNSWFDHKYPDYGYNNGTGIWLYNGKHTQNSYWADKAKTILCYDTYCYDGHNGLDFTYIDPQPQVPDDQDLPILSAAAGSVVDIKVGCPNIGDRGCGGGYGNYVILYHSVDNGNGYFTRYAHLSTVNVAIGAAVASGHTLGIMGNSGHSGGTHLHFEVYRDNGNAQWDGGTVDKVVDPYGWKRDIVDPWAADPRGLPSHRLWLYKPAKRSLLRGTRER